VISSSGCNIVPIEMAECFQTHGIRVVSIITRAHSDATASRRADGKKLGDFSDLIFDTGAPAGDAMIHIEGLETPVAPGSTVGGCLLINCLKVEVAARLVAADVRPSCSPRPRYAVPNGPRRCSNRPMMSMRGVLPNCMKISDADFTRIP
jgi:uncharacterized phosphosugar-binding protein